MVTVTERSGSHVKAHVASEVWQQIRFRDGLGKGRREPWNKVNSAGILIRVSDWGTWVPGQATSDRCDSAFNPQASFSYWSPCCQRAWIISTKSFELILKKELPISPGSGLPDRFTRRTGLGDGEKVIWEKIDVSPHKFYLAWLLWLGEKVIKTEGDTRTHNHNHPESYHNHTTSHIITYTINLSHTQSHTQSISHTQSHTFIQFHTTIHTNHSHNLTNNHIQSLTHNFTHVQHMQPHNHAHTHNYTHTHPFPTLSSQGLSS